MLELLAAITLIAVIAAVLLNRLMFYQEVAEKAKVEYTISILKSALRLQMATMLTEGRTRDYASLARQNPLDWLKEKSDNPAYASVAAGLASLRKISDQWQFDPDSGTLTYWPVHDEHLQPDASGQKRIRVQVKALYNSPDLLTPDVDAGAKSEDGMVLSLRLDVESYRWF